ncbi:MAG: DinB family protein [Chloroflexi bacterium]|nr:DinB family protein [Chloroflexota bacterium]
MTSARDDHLKNIDEIEIELLQILDGMDDVLDWRPDEDSWTAREVMTHMLYTPPGGVPQVLKGIMGGAISEYDLWADQKYITEEALAWTPKQVQQQLRHYFEALRGEIATLSDRAMEETTALVHQRNRHWDEPRPVQWLVERLFAGHWREHLAQLREIKLSASQ